jgi:D-lyxose ketol-isomerase
MPLKRSLINRSIQQAREAFDRFGIHLPPFAFWTPEEWQAKGPEVDEIRDCLLGWDVTDFGNGDFVQIGRTLLTLRNGNPRLHGYPKVYAEKLLYNPEGQRAPAHFHVRKMEDIINRAGGNLILQLTKASQTGRPSRKPLRVQVDGQTLEIPAGGTIRLEPGQSICLPPFTIHQFWGEEGSGPTVSSEVSSVCDDRTDNYFLTPSERFPAIEEDEPRLHYLCHEYPRK